MGYAKRKHGPPEVTAPAGPIEQDTPLDDRTAETILDAVFNHEDGNPVTGIRNAMIAAVAFWLVIAAVAFVLI
jgi:hypothetical protein